MNNKLWDYLLTLLVIMTGELIFLTSCEKNNNKPKIEYGSIIDIDGNAYKTVKIGTQEWMAENLKTTKYNDGTSIPLVTDNTAWSNLFTTGYCWYNNNETNKGTYGALYNWYTVKTSKLCPAGWHVPTDYEWVTMENYLIDNGFNYDGTTTGNNIAKALAAITLWTASTNTGDVGNTDYPANRNATGFTAVPGGLRLKNGVFIGIGREGSWWSATGGELPDNAWYHCLFYNDHSVFREHVISTFGYSVRCVRD
jgi:uncharacterized protein (TIGR02145 family)